MEDSDSGSITATSREALEPGQRCPGLAFCGVRVSQVLPYPYVLEGTGEVLKTTPPHTAMVPPANG
jgi:hypothetical protein